MTSVSQLPDLVHAPTGPSALIARLTTALRPVLLAVPPQYREDLQVAVEAALSAHVDVLTGAGFPSADTTSRLRRAGADWAVARHPVDHLLDVLNALTEQAADIAVSVLPGDLRGVRDGLEAGIVETGNATIAAVLGGYQESRQWKPRKVLSPQDCRALATSLLWGLRVDPAHQCALAGGYAVIAVSRSGGEAPSPLPDDLHSCLGFVPSGRLDYLVTPASDRETACGLAEELHRQLICPGWTAVTWRPRPEVPSGRREVHDVAIIAAASARQPEVYALDDVLVEYAVLQEELVADNLVGTIAPVIHHPALLRTLEALLAEDGNRSRAALRLGIHRSTLDYRLGRVEEITGWQPTSSRGLENLSIALITYAVFSSREDQAPPAP